MKLEFARQIFERSLNIKFQQSPSSGSREVPCGRTEGHGEAKGLFLQLYESA
jgi:hypothetical protein